MSKKALGNWIICLLVFLFIFLEFFHPISAFTQDLGRHLLLGKIILQTHQVPQTNLFSYTYPNFPFINSHWGSEVIFYLLTQTLGLPGLLFVMSCVAALSVVILVFAQPHPSPLLKGEGPSRFTLYALPLLLASGILLERTDLRPELFSFLFMSIFVAILWKYRNKTINHTLYTISLFALPLIEAIWVNMHIYFIVGPLLVGFFLLDYVLSAGRIKNFLFYVLHHTWPPRPQAIGISIRKHKIFLSDLSALFIVLILTSLATLLNPNGIAGALYPFTVFHNYGYTIEENQSIFFLLNYGIHHWSYLFFGISVFGLFLLLIVNFKRTRPIDWLLSITFTYIAASSIRNLPLFVFATLPSFVYLLSNVIASNAKQSHSKNNETKEKPSPFTLYAFPSMIFLLLCLCGYLFIHENGLGYSITTGAEKGADFYINNKLQGPLFNNFDIGSYLDYRLYPKTKVFVDGRPEAYPSSFFQNVYEPMQQDPKIFQEVDKKYHFQSIFFSYTDQTPWAQQFIQNIMQNPSWKLVYLDTFSAIWTPTTSHLAPLQPTTYTLPPDESVTDYLHLAYFFELTNWQQPLLATMQKIVSLDPTNCTALSVLVQNQSTRLLYSGRYVNYCK